MKPSRGKLDAATRSRHLFPAFAGFSFFHPAEISGARIGVVSIQALPSGHLRFVTAPSLRRQNARSGA